MNAISLTNQLCENNQKQWFGPQKKIIKIYKSHFPYTFLNREKNNVFFSNFRPTNLISIGPSPFVFNSIFPLAYSLSPPDLFKSELFSDGLDPFFSPIQEDDPSLFMEISKKKKDVVSPLPVKQKSRIKWNPRCLLHRPKIQLKETSQLLVQTFIKTQTNHWIRNKNFILAYLNPKKFIINPFSFNEEDNYSSLFEYLKLCKTQKSLISENLLTTYRYFQASNLNKEQFLNSLLEKDVSTNEYLELKQKKINKTKYARVKFIIDKKNIKTTHLMKSATLTRSNSLMQNTLSKSAKKKSFPLFRLPLFRLPLFRLPLFRLPLFRQQNQNNVLFFPRFGNEQWKYTRFVIEKKLVRNISNTQWILTNNFPQNFTIKSKRDSRERENFYFNQLHEKIKIPVAFEIFFNRRFLWNSNKITLQILNKKAFMVSLASDRKFKMTILKPLFKETKIKKIGQPFSKHRLAYQPINHQTKVSRILFSNLQLSGSKQYKNYFYKIAFGKDFSWINRIQYAWLHRFREEKKKSVRQIPRFILSRSYSNIVTLSNDKASLTKFSKKKHVPSFQAFDKKKNEQSRAFAFLSRISFFTLFYNFSSFFSPMEEQGEYISLLPNKKYKSLLRISKKNTVSPKKKQRPSKISLSLRLKERKKKALIGKHYLETSLVIFKEIRLSAIVNRSSLLSSSFRFSNQTSFFEPTVSSPKKTKYWLKKRTRVANREKL